MSRPYTGAYTWHLNTRHLTPIYYYGSFTRHRTYQLDQR